MMACTRKYTPGQPCCSCGCLIDADFGTPAWVATSGDWTEAYGSQATSDSEARMWRPDSPGGYVVLYIAVDFTSVNDVVRIGFCNVAGDKVWIEISLEDAGYSYYRLTVDTYEQSVGEAAVLLASVDRSDVTFAFPSAVYYPFLLWDPDYWAVGRAYASAPGKAWFGSRPMLLRGPSLRSSSNPALTRQKRSPSRCRSL